MRLYFSWGLIVLSFLAASALTLHDKQQSLWLGFTWQPIELAQGQFAWEVTSSNVPSLKKGNLLTHVRFAKHGFALNSGFLIRFPDASPTMAYFKRSLEQEAMAYEAANVPIVFSQSDGSQVALSAKPMRWQDLSGYFWAYHGFFYLCLLLAVGCLCLSKVSLDSRPIADISVEQMLMVCLLVSLGLCVLFGPVSLDRQWAMDSRLLLLRYHLSLYVASIYMAIWIVLLFRLPRNLFAKNYLFWGLYALCAGYFLLASHLIAWQHQGAMGLLHLAYALLPASVFALLALQWFLVCKDQSCLIDRAALKAAFSFNLCVGLTYGIYNFLLHSQILNAPTNPTLLNATMSLLMSLGTLLLIFRQHLYRITFWWWLLYAITFAALAFLLSFFVGSNFGQNYSSKNFIASVVVSVMVAMLVAFWFIFRLLSRHINIIQSATLSAQKTARLTVDSDAFWQAQADLLQRAFDCLQAELVVAATDDPDIKLCHSGEQMQLLILEEKRKALLLSAPNKGQRLFNEQDVKTASLLQDLMRVKEREQEAFAAGERQTRLQIAHDLHDDIGGRLHQMIYDESNNITHCAQNTLEQLRTLTHALHQDGQELGLFVASLRHDVLRHTESGMVNIEVDTYICETLNTYPLSSISMLQLSAIVSELCRNALQHKQVSQVELHIAVEPQTVSIKISNNGAQTEVEYWKKGIGMTSVKRRVLQLGGTVTWRANATGGASATLTFRTEKWLSM